jgi:Spy/CpxP family protein refolding chaperone
MTPTPLKTLLWTALLSVAATANAESDLLKNLSPQERAAIKAQLTPEQQARVEALQQRAENMSAAEKAVYKAKIDAAHQQWKNLSPEQQQALKEKHQNRLLSQLTPEQKAKLHTATDDEKQAMLHALKKARIHPADTAGAAVPATPVDTTAP